LIATFLKKLGRLTIDVDARRTLTATMECQASSRFTKKTSIGKTFEPT